MRINPQRWLKFQNVEIDLKVKSKEMIKSFLTENLF